MEVKTLPFSLQSHLNYGSIRHEACQPYLLVGVHSSLAPAVCIDGTNLNIYSFVVTFSWNNLSERVHMVIKQVIPDVHVLLNSVLCQLIIQPSPPPKQ